MDLRWSILAGYGPLFVSGLLMTIQLTLVALTAGLALGILLGLVATSHDAPPPASRPLAWALKALRGVTLRFLPPDSERRRRERAVDGPTGPQEVP